MSLPRFASALTCLAILALSCGRGLATAEAPYIGEWSNGRGETLVVTESTIRFGEDKAVSYRDLTRASDGSTFELLITARGDVNAFPGKYLAVTCENDSMEMVGYLTHEDLVQEQNAQQVVNWARDSDG